MTDIKQPIVHEGQLWKECDPRFERIVRVVSVYHAAGSVSLEQVSYDGHPPQRQRITKAKLSRFNGKRGGYEFYKDAP